MLRRTVILAHLSFPLWTSRASAQTTTSKYLFVGNSLTYYGNLPAVFDSLSRAAGALHESQMLVKGGALLADRVRDGFVSRALDAERYDYLILQDRGGDVAGFLGEKNKLAATRAAKKLVEVAKSKGSSPIYLGTYQGNAAASAQLVEAESALARSIGVPYISVSDRFGAGLRTHPDLRWLHDDGMHPGSELTLLMAALLLDAVNGNLPAAQPIHVSAPIYGPGSEFFPPALASKRAKANIPTPQAHTYSAEVVERVLTIARGTAK